jgi:hypothetical protein
MIAPDTDEYLTYKDERLDVICSYLQFLDNDFNPNHMNHIPCASIVSCSVITDDGDIKPVTGFRFKTLSDLYYFMRAEQASEQFYSSNYIYIHAINILKREVHVYECTGVRPPFMLSIIPGVKVPTFTSNDDCFDIHEVITQYTGDICKGWARIKNHTIVYFHNKNDLLYYVERVAALNVHSDNHVFITVDWLGNSLTMKRGKA